MSEEIVISTKKIAKEVKYQRLLKGYTASKLAQLSKVDPSTISLLEKGEANPTIGNLEKIFNALEFNFNISITQK